MEEDLREFSKLSFALFFSIRVTFALKKTEQPNSSHKADLQRARTLAMEPKIVVIMA